MRAWVMISETKKTFNRTTIYFAIFSLSLKIEKTRKKKTSNKARNDLAAFL